MLNKELLLTSLNNSKDGWKITVEHQRSKDTFGYISSLIGSCQYLTDTTPRLEKLTAFVDDMNDIVINSIRIEQNTQGILIRPDKNMTWQVYSSQIIPDHSQPIFTLQDVAKTITIHYKANL